MPEVWPRQGSAKQVREAAEPIPGPFTRKLCSLARHYKIAIVVGMEERVNGSVFNSAVFIEQIGFPGTKAYVKSVLRHYAFYRLLNRIGV